MKIIAKSDNGWLIDAAEIEIANLVGVSYASEDDARRALRIGAEIKVAAMYAKLYAMKGKSVSLRATAKNLREAADLIESKIVAVVESVEP